MLWRGSESESALIISGRTVKWPILEQGPRSGDGLVWLEEEEEWWCFRGHAALKKLLGRKLSVPPPLNLPSLRKEHERIDSLGSGGGHGSGGPGNGLRPSSSGMGWSKPAAIVVQEKEGLDVSGVNNGAESGNNYGGDQGVSNGVNKLSTGSSGGVYMPPTVRSVELTVVSDGSRGYSVANKVWKGEDFPSLQATLSSVSGPEKKQKDGLNQKQKQARNTVGNGLDEDGVDNQGLGHSVTSKKERKQQEYFCGSFAISSVES
ncbi:hypothetical protein OIU84_005942 [Salix udensis]|uniref:Uncharacterized protein n=1 Tax=Salix udensis TaxID=889485 RepID=A0AAD6P1K0_9ROSI|nr:hypothetical protein OIU84_005942 [Salix udensis]